MPRPLRSDTGLHQRMQLMLRQFGTLCLWLVFPDDPQGGGFTGLIDADDAPFAAPLRIAQAGADQSMGLINARVHGSSAWIGCSVA